jgi:hypothetical protein
VQKAISALFQHCGIPDVLGPDALDEGGAARLWLTGPT